MATLRYADVYFSEIRAGLLQETAGGERTQFKYSQEYLNSGNPPLSLSLPLQEEVFEDYGLIPYFDNLSAEGWLATLQARCLGNQNLKNDKFRLLTGFGYDLIGAVEVRDPDGFQALNHEYFSEAGWEAAVSRISISGVQPKIPLVKNGNTFSIPAPNETSTHIGKLHSDSFSQLLHLEDLCTDISKVLLPDDEVIEKEWTNIEPISGDILAIKRFDRKNGNRMHFEEFAQAAGLKSAQKYDFEFSSLNALINNLHGSPIDKDRLFRRILSALLLGNSDIHAKNFGWLPKQGMTPSYDLPGCDFLMKHGSDIGMLLNGETIKWSQLKAKQLILIGESLEIGTLAMKLAFNDFEKRLPKALEVISSYPHFNKNEGYDFKTEYIKYIEKSWNRTFSQTGKILSKRRSKQGKIKKSLKND